MGAGTNSTKHEFIFCVVNQTTFRELRNGRFPPNLVTKRIPVSRRRIRKIFSKLFTLAVICPQNLKSKIKQAPHSEQPATGHGMHCLLHVVVQGPGSFRGQVNFFYDIRLRSYGASKLPNFRILAYFPYTKPLKRTFRWPANSPAVTSQNDSDFPMW